MYKDGFNSIMLLKKKKRSELMKLKNILILILCIVLCPPIVMAVSDNTVYTEFTGGNSSSTGNGTEQSPYNLFEDALNAVEYVSAKKAHL